MRCAQGETLSGRVALVTGATGSRGAAIAQRLAVFDRMMRVNLHGPFWTAKYAIPHMLRTGTGGAMSAYPAPVIAEAKSDKRG
jgi:NAD(P)-dependent dehydrogenase (short-subunit alcohol dehydrogenase family)